MIDWKRKLASRKFWSYLVTEIMCILAFTTLSEDIKSKIIALVIASANTIGYMFAESWTDVNGAETIQVEETVDIGLEEVDVDDEEPELTEEPEVDLSKETGITPEQMLEA